MARARPEKLVEHALSMIVQIEGASPDQARAAACRFTQWRQAADDNEAAAQEARRRWDALFALSSELRDHFDEPAAPARRAPRAAKRRDLLLGLAGIATAGLLATMGWRWHARQPLHLAQHRTGKAQTLKVPLDDGSPGTAMTLSPGSELSVALYRDRRIVTLRQGEAHFDVAPDAARPFEVRAKAATIEVLGTAFTVRERGHALFVGVAHGHVQVSLPSGQPFHLHRGQGLTVRDGRPEGVQGIDVDALSAWREGWLVFQDARLDDALEELNTYLRSDVVALDDEVAALRFSGRFRSTGIDTIIATLPRILPIVAERLPGGGIRLRARPSARPA